MRSVKPKALSTETGPRISARLPKKPIETASWPAWPWMSSGLPAAVASTNVVSSPKPVFRVVRTGERKMLVIVPSTVKVLPPRAAEDRQAAGVVVDVVDRGGRQAGDLAVRAVVEEQRGLAGRVSRVVERQVGEAEGVVDVDRAEQSPACPAHRIGRPG